MIKFFIQKYLVDIWLFSQLIFFQISSRSNHDVISTSFLEEFRLRRQSRHFETSIFISTKSKTSSADLRRRRRICRSRWFEPTLLERKITIDISSLKKKIWKLEKNIFWKNLRWFYWLDRTNKYKSCFWLFLNEFELS